MNAFQRIILVGATIVLACMVLFPPWTFVYEPPKGSLGPFSNKATRPAGYHLLLSSHVPEDQTQLTALFGLPNFARFAVPSSYLVRKVYETDHLTCPKCQGEMRIISLIDQPEVIKKILQQLALWEESHAPPGRGPAIKEITFDPSYNQVI